MIKDSEGNLVSSKEDILKKWAQYYAKTFQEADNGPGNEMTITEDNRTFEEEPDTHPLTIEEVKEATKEAKNNKAPGQDTIPAELKKGGDIVIRKLHAILESIWTEGTDIPDD